MELKSMTLFQAVKKPLYSLYLSILRLTAFPFLSLWYVINIRGGDYQDIFYTIMEGIIQKIRYKKNDAFSF